MLGAAIGAVAGLVAITPAAGYVTPGASVLIGMGVGVALLRRGVAAPACPRRRRPRRVQRPRCRRPIGALATGIFATTAVNAAGARWPAGRQPRPAPGPGARRRRGGRLLGGRDRRDPRRRQSRGPDPRPRARRRRPASISPSTARSPTSPSREITDGHRRPGRLHDSVRRVDARAGWSVPPSSRRWSARTRSSSRSWRPPEPRSRHRGPAWADGSAGSRARRALAENHRMDRAEIDRSARQRAPVGAQHPVVTAWPARSNSDPGCQGTSRWRRCRAPSTWCSSARIRSSSSMSAWSWPRR